MTATLDPTLGLAPEAFLVALDRELATSVARLEDSPFLRGLAEGTRTRALYIAYLREAYHFVRLTSSFTPLAARRLDSRFVHLRKWILTHSAEELGHELMARHDLGLLGEDSASVEASEPLPGTVAWVSFFHYHVAIENPFSALGVLYFLEGMAAKLAPIALQHVVAALGPTEKKALTFFREHGALDVDHVTEQRRELARDCTRSDDQNAVLVTIRRAGYVKRLLLDVIAERTLRSRRSRPEGPLVSEVTARPSRGGDPRSWIAELVDAGTFLPLFGSGEGGAYAHGKEVVAGVALVGGRPVALYAQDPSSGQGLTSARGAGKILRLMRRAEGRAVPVIALLSSAGVDVQEGLRSGEAYTEVIAANIALSTVVPQIAVVMGVTMGAPAYSATLMDLVLFNKSRSHLVVTGPTVVERMIGQRTTLGELGGSVTHARTTGIAHFVDAAIPSQIERLKWLVGFLPSSAQEDPPRVASEAPTAPLPIIPDRLDRPFDMRKLVAAIVDGSRFVEYSAEFGRAIVTAFARIDGQAVGVVANQSHQSTGAIDAEAAQKAARFIRLCDSYRIPIVTLIDVPGFMPGVREEHRGLLRHGAHLCAAMRTRVPRLSVVVRRCYGAAAFLMLQSRAQGGDLVLALEGARISAMGFDAAKHMIYRDRVEGADEVALAALREEYARDYEAPSVAFAEGLIDEIVSAGAVREKLAAHLTWLRRKRPKKWAARGLLP